MIKFDIDENMINFIKECREKYNVKSSDLAMKIDKSNAYVSKFDKGDYKSISYDELCQMFSAICDKTNSTQKVEISEEGKKLCDDFLTSCLLNDEDGVYEKDCAFLTYDDVFRNIEISSELIDYINKIINDKKLDLKNIIIKSNENNDLPADANINKLQPNIYYSFEIDGATHILIKMNLEESIIRGILNKEIKSTNYITIKSLLYTIFRLTDLDKSISELLAINIMDSFHFYNLVHTRNAINADKLIKSVSKSLENMPTFIIKVLCGYTDLICDFYNHAKPYTTTKLLGLHTNLTNDASLVVASMDLPLHKLKDLDVKNKRKFLNEVTELIDKYAENKNESKDFQII